VETDRPLQDPQDPQDPQGSPPHSRPAEPAAAMPTPPRPALWQEAARSAFFFAPRYSGLHATPATVALLLLAGLILAVLFDRLYIEGPARLYVEALREGWWVSLALGLACWLLVPRAGQQPQQAPSAMALWALVLAQMLLVSSLSAAVLLPLARSGTWQAWADAGGARAAALWLPALWWVTAALVLLVRSATAEAGRRTAAVALAAAVLTLDVLWHPPRLWYPAPPKEPDSEWTPLSLDALQGQQALLTRQLAALAPQRPGVIDLYALTFAPYADEDVFMRESALVAGVMKSRFDAAGRTLELVSHAKLLADKPAATRAHLRQALQAVAARMDRAEDVLFIHLTSHGAKDGALSAGLGVLAVEPVRPQELKAWLDEAGIQHRIVSVSACYAGSWIEPLAGDGTLVLTAADAEHTSYGCGRHSELTFFGRAMYDEQLRKTRSFEAAHAAARGVIDEREKAAGKADGYSNPQLRMGPALRAKLAALEQRLDAAGR
jgi:hypothetical protein